MIVQVGSAKFGPTARLAVPFEQPTRPGSAVAVAFMLAEPAATIARVTDVAAGPRCWRLANDTLLGSSRRRVCWIRVGGPPGITELIGEPPSGAAVSGTALAVESQSHPGLALQALAELLEGTP